MKFNYAFNTNDLYFFFQIFCVSLKYLTSQKSKIPLSIYVLYRNFSPIELCDHKRRGRIVRYIFKLFTNKRRNILLSSMQPHKITINYRCQETCTYIGFSKNTLIQCRILVLPIFDPLVSIFNSVDASRENKY